MSRRPLECFPTILRLLPNQPVHIWKKYRMPSFLQRWATHFYGRHIYDRVLPGGSKKSFRNHVAWSKRRHVNVKSIATSRCLKSTVIVSLIIRTNMGILYSSSEVGDRIREGLENSEYKEYHFWIGVMVCISVRRFLAGALHTNACLPFLTFVVPILFSYLGLCLRSLPTTQPTACSIP